MNFNSNKNDNDILINDTSLDSTEINTMDHVNDYIKMITKDVNENKLSQSTIISEINNLKKDIQNIYKDKSPSNDSKNLYDEISNLQKKIKNLEADINRPVYNSKSDNKSQAVNDLKRGLVEFVKTGRFQSDDLRGIRQSSNEGSVLIPNYLVQMAMSAEKYDSMFNHTNHIEVTGSCTILVNRIKTGNQFDIKPSEINRPNPNNYEEISSEDTFIIDQSPLVTQVTISDSIRQAHNFSQILMQQMMYQLNRAQDNLIFKGTTDNEPEGILSYEHYASNPEANDFVGIKSLECDFQQIIDNPLEQILTLYSALSSGYIDQSTKIFMSQKMLNIIRTYKKMDGSSIFGIVSENFNPNVNASFSILGHEVVIKNQLSAQGAEYIYFMNTKEFYTTTAPSNIEMFIDPYQKRPFITIGLQDAIGGQITNPNAAVRLVVKTKKESKSE
jgi:HK97 family phage major capsid protein